MTDPSTAFINRIPVFYYARFQGIPGVIFGDGPRPTVAGTSYSPSLRIKDQIISHDLQLGKAIGAGRALDMMLDADLLEASGIYASHFSPPDTITNTTGAVKKGDTTIAVDSTTDFASSGSFFWGHEKISYSGKTSLTFTGCTRGTGLSATGINYATAIPEGTGGAWSIVSNTPVLWRGRLVEIWAVAGTPDGWLLGVPGTVSDASWRVWVGHVDGQPTIAPTGITIRALPAERSADRTYGWGGSWKIAPVPTDANGEEKQASDLVYWPVGGIVGFALVYVDHNDSSKKKTIFAQTDPFSGAGAGADSPTRVLSPIEILKLCETHIAGHDALTSVTFKFANAGGGVFFEINFDDSNDYVFDLSIAPIGNASHLYQCFGKSVLSFTSINGDISDQIGDYATLPPPPPLTPMRRGGVHIINPEEGSEHVYAAAPFVGQHVAWDQGEETYAAKVERVFERNDGSFFAVLGANIAIGSAPPLPSQPFTEVKELKEAMEIATPALIGETWARLLNSSGTAEFAPAADGSFGAFDELPIGWGARIPGDWTASSLSTETAEDTISPFIVLDLEAKSLFLDAIARKVAITQRFTSGKSEIAIGRMYAPQEAETETTIGLSEIMAQPIKLGLREKPPNVVEVEFLNPAKPPMIIKNKARIAAEGQIKKETFKVPSQWATANLESLIMAVQTPDQILSDVYVYQIAVGPATAWSVNPGDRVTISGTHYAWSDLPSGSHRAASISGRVIGVSRNLDGSGGSISLAIWGQVYGDYYAPDTEIDSLASQTVFTVPSGRGAWFAEGEYIAIYRPGEEDTKYTAKVITDITGDTITINSGASWTVAADDRLLFPVYASASARMRNWAFVNDGGIVS